MFRLKGFGVGFWRDLLRRVEGVSGCCGGDGDLCLVGSYARGDASPLSDVDFVVFSEGESKLKRTEMFCINDKMVALFSVRAADLIIAESLDFYSANNPFEARLICGEGKVLNKLRSGLRGKSIDLDATKRLICGTASARLLSSLSDVALDYGEGIRSMRVCLAKARLYAKLFKESVEPWSIIPYNYKPVDELERLVEHLYRSKNYSELSKRIGKLDLTDLMAKTFHKHVKTIDKAVKNIIDDAGFAGKHVKNYAGLYMLVEERVRSTMWEGLPPRWKIVEELNSKITHYHTFITCTEKTVEWIVSTGKGADIKPKEYGCTTF